MVWLLQQASEKVRHNCVFSIAAPELFRGEIGWPSVGIRASEETQQVDLFSTVLAHHKPKIKLCQLDYTSKIMYYFK